MSTLEEIAKEKQRIGEALARVDAQREKLTGQLGELEAAERVLARYSKGTPARKTASAKTPTTATKAAAVPRPRLPRTRAEEPAGGKRTSSTLSEQVLALAIGKTQREIAAACKGARPNHVGGAIARYKRAGRIEERDGKLYATQSRGDGATPAI
jgi:hypothetical protein